MESLRGRYYDSQLGRWHSIDPMAGKYSNVSPYVYVINNSLIFIDPTGAYIEPGSQAEWKNRLTMSNQKGVTFRVQLTI